MSPIEAASPHPMTRLLSCLLLALLVLPVPLEVSAVNKSAGSAGDAWRRVADSWALGVVVPDGATLSGGRPLSWSAVSNLTAVVVLPDITRPDGITYVVLSAMGSDRTIFQVAAGAWPGSACWSVYSWYVTGVDSRSPSYQWTSNSTGAEFLAGDELSISMASSSSGWTFAVIDRTRDAAQSGSFPASPSVAFANGDQEVLALESYSHSASTFTEMGNLTLRSILVNGDEAVRGWYYYSGWDPSHSPLFVVGSSQAPLFISLTTSARGEPVWGYSTEWADVHLDVPPHILGETLAVLGAGAIAAAAVAMQRKEKGRPARPSPKA